MMQNVTIIPQSFLLSLLSKSQQVSFRGKHCSDFSHHITFLPVLELHMIGIMQYVLWLLLFTITFFETHQFVACITRVYFYELIVFCWMNIEQFVYPSPADRCTSCFWFLAIVNTVAVNIFIQFWWTCVFIALGKMSRRLLGYRVSEYV